VDVHVQPPLAVLLVLMEKVRERGASTDLQWTSSHFDGDQYVSLLSAAASSAAAAAAAGLLSSVLFKGLSMLLTNVVTAAADEPHGAAMLS